MTPSWELPAGKTAGEKALAEAARLEAARFYGDVLAPDHNEPYSVFAARAEAELADSLVRAAERDDSAVLRDLIAEGLTPSRLVNEYGYTYGQVRAARKQAMKGVA